jgi:hypothetical protein
VTNPRRSTPRVTLASVATFLGFMALGGVAGAYAARTALFGLGELGLGGLQVAALVALGAALLPLLVLAHELGHVAGGKLAGFRAVLVVVGFARWQKEDGRWRMTLNRSTALMGGLAVWVPQGRNNTPPRLGRVILGGPLASLAGGAAGVALWLALPPLAPGDGFATVAAYVAVGVLGFGNLFLAAVSLAPTRAGGFHSDGARLLGLRRGGPALERETAIFLLSGASYAGARPRDWDTALVRKAVGEADGSLFHAVGVQLAFSHACDRGELDAAREHAHALLAVEEVFPPMVRPVVRLGLVPFFALRAGEGERARELVERSGDGLLIDRHLRHLAQAAAAWTAGDAARAAAELARAEAELPRAVDRGAAAVAADLLRELRALLAGAPAAEAVLA